MKATKACTNSIEIRFCSLLASVRKFIFTVILKTISTIQKIWDGINSLVDTKKKNRKSIGSIRRHDDQLSQDPIDHANILNGHFASVGPRLPSSIPNRNELFSQYLPNI